MSQPRSVPQYAPIGLPHPARPFDDAAARELIAELTARRVRPGELKTHRAHPHIIVARPVAREPANGRHVRWAGYGIAASLTLLVIAGTPALHSRGNEASVAQHRAVPATIVQAVATPSAIAAEPRAAREARVQLASLTPQSSLSARAGKLGAPASALARPPEISDDVGSERSQPADSNAEAAPAAAPEVAPRRPEIQVAALEMPHPSAGQPLMVVKAQSAAALLGSEGDPLRTGGGLATIQSGNPQRMASGITGAVGR